MTPSSVETKERRSEPDRTQCGADGFNAALLKAPQDLQQQTACCEVDQSTIACLWLQSWSRTAACLMKTFLKDGV